MSFFFYIFTGPKEFIYKGIHSCILLRFLVYYFVTTIVDELKLDKLYTTVYTTQNIYVHYYVYYIIVTMEYAAVYTSVYQLFWPCVFSCK